MTRPQPMDHLPSQKQKKPVTKRVPIALDSDVADAYEEAKVAYDEAKRSDDYKSTDASRAALAEATEALEAARAELEENTEIFVFRSIGRKPFEDLVDEHQPTQEQVAEAKKTNTELN